MADRETSPEYVELESPLREAVEAVRSEPVPEDPVARVIERAQRAPSLPRPPSARPWLRWAIVPAAAAAVLMAVLMGLQTLSRHALADVIAAIEKQPWLHATGTAQGGQEGEFWFSPRHGVLASRMGDQMYFADQQRQTVEIYGFPGDPETVQQLPLEGSRGFEEAEAGFLAMLSGDLESGMKAGGRKIVRHDQRKLRRDGRDAVEHRFVLGVDGRDELQMESVLVVDSESRLPIWWQVRHDGHVIGEYDVSYPADGPRSIYALGAPHGAPRLDLAPSDGLERILAGMRAARQQFPAYRAVVISSGSADHRDWGSNVLEVWRKGDRWRVDQLDRGLVLSGPNPEEIIRNQFPNQTLRKYLPIDADPNEWWLEHARELRKWPRVVYDGNQEWLFEAVRGGPDESGNQFVESIRKERALAQRSDSDDPRPFHSHEMPEYAGYPHLPRAKSPGYQTTVDPHPKAGPPGTVLVEIRPTARRLHPNAFSAERYWIHPDRGHLCVRQEYLKRADGIDRLDQSVEIVEADQSPDGFWYPTLIRVPDSSVHLDTSEVSDTYHRFYVTFKEEIPDSLFDADAAEAAGVHVPRPRRK